LAQGRRRLGIAIRIRFLVALLTTSMTTGICLAQTASVADGYSLAGGLCARCHAIRRGGGGSWTNAPSFQSIADRPEVTRAWLLDVVLKPHIKMSANSFSRTQANSIADYILSLRVRPETS